MASESPYGSPRDRDHSRVRFLEKAMFWVAVAGITVVIGSALVLTGVALRPADTSVWSEPWFDAGIGCLVLGSVLLLVALRHYFAEQGKSVSAALVSLGRVIGRTVAALRSTFSGLQWQSPIRSPIVRRGSSSAYVGSSHRDLTIVRATYGGTDVTARVRSLLHQRLTFTADNGTLVDDVDPEPGIVKLFQVECRVGSGPTTTASFDEGASVDLP